MGTRAHFLSLTTRFVPVHRVDTHSSAVGVAIRKSGIYAK